MSNHTCFFKRHILPDKQNLRKSSDFYRLIIQSIRTKNLLLVQEIVQLHWPDYYVTQADIAHGICAMDKGEEKTKFLNFCRQEVKENLFHLIFSNDVSSLAIAGTNDVEFAQQMIPWQRMTRHRKDQFLKSALQRSFGEHRNKNKNQDMLHFLFYEKKWIRFLKNKTKLPLHWID
jgi:hypothetical protein